MRTDTLYEHVMTVILPIHNKQYVKSLYGYLQKHNIDEIYEIRFTGIPESTK
jgi:hypothetical protein